MDDKLKVFWNLDVLVKMSRSKSDGPSLRVEEEEIETKLKNYNQEIDEINSISEEEIYDTSAEMADRNIEIITKKQLQTLRSELKEKNKELTKLKEEEELLYNQNTLLRDNKNSQEKYMLSMEDRIGETTDSDIIARYNTLISETSQYIENLDKELKSQNTNYEDIQSQIIEHTEIIKNLEEKIDKKKKILAETQASLENRDNYIDKSKKEKNNKRIVDLENKKKVLTSRLEEIRNDPKYLESKIKEIINNKEDLSKTRPYLINLLNQVIRIPYINVPTNNALEEELLRATQARDSFANEIDQKTYNILEANTPEKVRTEFLNERISKWNDELETLKEKISDIDKDNQFDYSSKDKIIAEMLATMKNDYNEFQRAYDETPDTSIGAKARLKASLEEKKEDIIETEKIATSFKIDEAEDIESATRIIKYECENLNEKIKNAEEEINRLKNRLTSKKSGLIDITSKNKDKDILKELAQIVIDIKHRRQFPEAPIDIINRLEEALELNLMKAIDSEVINETNQIIPRDYDQYIKEDYQVIDSLDETFIDEVPSPPKRGIKVINEAKITVPSNLFKEIDEANSDNENNSSNSTSSIDITESNQVVNKNSEEENNDNYIQEEITIKEPSEQEDLSSISESEEDISPIIEDTPSELETTSEENTSTQQEEHNETEAIIPEESSSEKEITSEEENPLSLDTIFNPQKKYEELQSSNNQVSTENLTHELDQYINSLDSNQN